MAQSAFQTKPRPAMRRIYSLYCGTRRRAQTRTTRAGARCFHSGRARSRTRFNIWHAQNLDQRSIKRLPCPCHAAFLRGCTESSGPTGTPRVLYSGARSVADRNSVPLADKVRILRGNALILPVTRRAKALRIQTSPAYPLNTARKLPAAPARLPSLQPMCIRNVLSLL